MGSFSFTPAGVTAPSLRAIPSTPPGTLKTLEEISCLPPVHRFGLNTFVRDCLCVDKICSQVKLTEFHFLRGGEAVAVGNADGGVDVYMLLPTPSHVFRFAGHKGLINKLRWNSQGTLSLSLSQGKREARFECVFFLFQWIAEFGLHPPLMMGWLQSTI